jgi:coniferyl-aldehyde dehydrogenase
MSATLQTPNAELDRLFSLQQRAFSADRFPTLDARLERLERMARMMIAFRGRFHASLREDFGSHHPILTDLFETGPVIARARYISRQLGEWMKPRAIDLGEAVHGSSRGEVMCQPKGVVGNIAPWNFPVECSLVMVNDMLAAGNRVIVKPSELAPATAVVLQEAVAAHFDESLLAVVNGGVELARYFASLPWNHLTYTGSPRVGRLVMEAAAKNLVPVTLELGGKNPTLFAADAIEEQLVERFLNFRSLKGGQVCTSPDYVLVPEGRVGEWIACARNAWSKLFPRYVGQQDATGVINAAHFRRILGYVEEARARGVEVIPLCGEQPDPVRRQIPMIVIVDPPDDLACMNEEIFGPVTPLVTFRTLEEAIARINAGPSPLAAYVVTRDETLAARFAREVRSGGTGVNTFGSQGAHHALPFGGVGTSGIGCHSGHEGFLNYSHTKSVFRMADDAPLLSVLRPPFGGAMQALVDAMFAPRA